MDCVRKNCVCAFFLGLFICSQSIAANGKDSRDGKSPVSENNTSAPAAARDQFQWNEHNKLSWDDFRGEVNAVTDASAAATHCGIGFKAKKTVPGSNPKIIVYNTFYTAKSWVRPDAKIASILYHEQGHFDLCEIYTRKLRARMDKFDFNVPDVMQALMRIYTEVSDAYESRQQSYEQETVHGTNPAQQKKWSDMIALELSR